MLINLWTKKAQDEVRGITFGDVANKNTLIFASWDGKIYFINSENGSNIWVFSPKDVEGPAEFVEVMENRFGPPIIVATVGRNLIGLDAENREMIWHTTLDSWIYTLKKIDINDDGEEEIVALTMNGTIFGVDLNGEKTWSITGSRPSTPYLIYTSDIDIDGNDEIIKLGKGSKHLEIVGCDGGIISRYKLEKDIKSMTVGSFEEGGPPTILIGLESGFAFIKDNKISYQKIRGGHLPYTLKAVDINDDEIDEILVGDWKSNKLKIYGVDKGTIRKAKDFKLIGNPVYLNAVDLNGSGKVVITVGVKSKNVGGDRFYFIPMNGKMQSLPWFGGYNGVSMGDIIGENGLEIALRTNREELSLFIDIPRVTSPQFLEESDKAEIGYWSQANYNLETTGPIKVIDRIHYSRKKFSGLGYIIRSRFQVKASRAGVSKLKLVRKNKSEIIRKVYVASKTAKLSTSIPIILYKEDLIPIDISDKIKRIFPKSLFVKTNIEENKEKLYLDIALRSTGWIKIPLEVELIDGRKIVKKSIEMKAVVKDPLSAEIRSDPIILTNDKIKVRIKNYSRKSLKINVTLGEPIDSEIKQVKVKPNSVKTITLKLSYEPDEVKEEVKTVVYLTYQGLLEHKHNFPVRLTFVNDRLVRELLKELKSIVKNKN